MVGTCPGSILRGGNSPGCICPWVYVRGYFSEVFAGGICPGLFVLIPGMSRDQLCLVESFGL